MRPEMRMARYVAGLERYRAVRISCVDAADFLGGAGQRFRQAKPGGMAGGGICERHFRRLRDRYEAYGAESLIDRRRGKVSGRRPAVDKIEWVLEQFMTRTFDFTAKHFHEELSKGGFDLSYTWTKTLLQQRGLIGVALGASQEAPSPAVAGDDAVPGRLDARMAGRPAAAGPHRHPG
jgi:Helix-turn-helix domain